MQLTSWCIIKKRHSIGDISSSSLRTRFVLSYIIINSRFSHLLSMFWRFSFRIPSSQDFEPKFWVQYKLGYKLLNYEKHLENLFPIFNSWSQTLTIMVSSYLSIEHPSTLILFGIKPKHHTFLFVLCLPSKFTQTINPLVYLLFNIKIRPNFNFSCLLFTFRVHLNIKPSYLYLVCL